MRIDHPVFVSILALGLSSTTLVTLAVRQGSDGACRGDVTIAPQLHIEHFAGAEPGELVGELPVTLECDATRCVVDRDALLAALEQPEPFLRQARVVPVIQGGEQRGFKLYGIRGDGVLWALGLRNGDILTAINGHPLAAPDSAMASYRTLERADALAVDFERAGEPRTITLELR